MPGFRVPIEEGARAYVPSPLPPSIDIDAGLLAEASAALARLDGMAATWGTLLNIDQFAYLLARQEAVFSSGIEGTASTISDVLRFEALREVGPAGAEDAGEVLAYVHALDSVFASDLPLSRRLLNTAHKCLLSGARGANMAPGELRTSQVRIGGTGYHDASYIPPPVPQMTEALNDLELYLNGSGEPALIQAAYAHAQFEMIHPYFDGNGRVGRLLILLILKRHDLLSQPLLNMSWYFKQYQTEYYERLRLISETDDWKGWTRFFLRGVREVAGRSASILQGLGTLQQAHGALVDERIASRYGRPLLDLLFQTGWVDSPSVVAGVHCTPPTARSLLAQFDQAGILQAIPGTRRPRVYMYPALLGLFA